MTTPWRLDRLATLLLFHRVARWTANGDSPRIPILMYHSISKSSGMGGHPYYEVCTEPHVFEHHLRFLKEHGYAGLRLSEAAHLVESKRLPRAKTVVITFDDGYDDFRTHAFPLLQQAGFPASMYLPTAHIGRSVRRFKDRDCMTWSAIRELHSAGVEFGSHTATHPQLHDVSAEQRKEELLGSRQAIEDELGTPVTSFAYPYAFPETDRAFQQELRDTLVACGYECGVTTVLGRAGMEDDPLFLRRLPANTWDDQRFFQAKLEGGYDWLHALQYASKTVKGRLS